MAQILIGGKKRLHPKFLKVVWTAVTQKKILVPIDPESKNLKALYHALALAERIQAKVFILLSRPARNPHKTDGWVEEVLMDVIHGACEEGLQVSYHIAEDGFEDEVISLVESEHIDLIVVGAEKGPIKDILQRIIPQMSAQIIQVKGKDNTADLVE
jgi:nucleotide-binding universal stress UspA family protein